MGDTVDNRISWLRVVACFLVVVLHTSAAVSPPLGHAGWWAANTYNSFSRVCVPIFLMISGYTLLEKEEAITQFVKKRVLRIVPPLLFWSCFYLWWRQYNGEVTGNWAVAIISGPAMYHLWYLYAILGIYATIPLLREAFATIRPSTAIWSLAVWILGSSLGPSVYSAIHFSECVKLSSAGNASVYSISYFGSLLGYVALGAVIPRVKIRFTVGICMYLGGSVGTALAVYVQSSQIGLLCDTFYQYLSPMIVLASCGLFAAFMSLSAAHTPKFVSMIAASALGIYCFHLFVIGAVFQWIHVMPVHNHFWIEVPIVSLAGFSLSALVIILLRLVKPFRMVL